MRTINEQDYLAAVNAASTENYVDIWSCEIVDEGIDQETLLARRQAYYNLSEEARRVIRIVINSPMEVIETIAGSPKRKRPSASRIERHLAKKWRNPLKAYKAVNEIKGFVRDYL